MKITVTRIHRGFSNVADTYVLGPDESEGRTSVTEYDLPDGYSLDDGRGVIRDPDGIEVALAPHPDGINLVSRAGSRPDTVMRPAP